MHGTEQDESNTDSDADSVGRLNAGKPAAEADTSAAVTTHWGEYEAASSGSTRIKTITPVKAHCMRRFTAFLVDYVGLMWVVTSIGWVMSLIPGMTTSPFWHAVPAQLIVTVLLLTRDYFFEGRGIGKNFFGLQVVDALTGKPVTLLQSVRRNAPLIAPFVVLGMTLWFTQHLPISASNEFIGMVVAALGTIYLILIFPIEVYRIIFRPDGMRVSDVWSKTAIVAAQPSFRNPLSQVKAN